MNQPVLTDEEIQTLREALGEEPASSRHEAERAALAKDFAGLRALLGAPPAAPEGATGEPVIPPLPGHIRARLERERDALRKKFLDTASGETGGARGTGPAFTVIDGESRRQTGLPNARQRSSTPWLALAAAVAVIAGLVTFLLPSGDPSQPVFAWQNAADEAQRYDVWVLPAEGDVETAPAVFVATNVRSPLSLKDMKPGPAATPGQATLLATASSRLLVCLASIGRAGGVAEPFTPAAKVTVTAPTPEAILRRLLESGRAEEARQAFAKLPPSVRESTDLAPLRRELGL